MPSKCKSQTLDGRRCQAYSVYESSFCFWHNPKMKDKRTEARKKGRQHRRKHRGGDVIEYEIKTYNDIQKILAKAINDLVSGESTARESRAIGYLCNLAKSIQGAAQYERDFKEGDYI